MKSRDRMNDRIQILIGNNIEVMKKMEPDSIDVCVTSPPYWALRDYGSDPAIWGGDENCSHEWEDHTEPARGGIGDANVGANKDGQANNRGIPRSRPIVRSAEHGKGSWDLNPIRWNI